MKFSIAYSIAVAAAVVAAAPCVNAQAKKPAVEQKKFMDNRAFNDTMNKINRTFNKKPAEACAELLKFYAADDMSDAQKNQIISRYAYFAARSNNPELIKDAIRVNAVGSTGMKNQLAQDLLRIKQNPYKADAEKLIGDIVAAYEKDPKKENGSFTGMINGLAHLKDYFAMACSFYDKYEKQIPEDTKVNLLAHLAGRALINMGDAKAADKYGSALITITKARKVTADAAEAKAKAAGKQDLAGTRPYRDAAKRVEQLLNDYLTISTEQGQAFFAKAKDALSDHQKQVFEMGKVVAKEARQGNIAPYKAIKDKVLAMPYNWAREQIINELVKAIPHAEGNLLLESQLKDPNIDGKTRFNRLNALRGRCGNVRRFQRSYNNPKAYPNWRKFTDQMLATIETVEKNKPGDANFYRQNAEISYDYGDFAFAEQQIRKALELNPAKCVDTAVMIYLHRKDTATVSDIIANEIKDKDAAKSRHWRMVDYFNQGGNCKGFDKAFANEKLTSAQKMVCLRNVSEIMFRATRFDICQEIYDYIQKEMFVSLAPPKHTATFDRNTPKTADGFARTPYYNEWDKMATGFRPYGDCPAVSPVRDATRFLKDAVQPKCDPAFRTGVRILYDVQGVHIFVRCDDPAVMEVVEGKRTGGTLECTFRPNPNAPYNMWFFSKLPSNYDAVDLDFASASPRYKLTKDNFQMDATLTEEGIVAHTYIPWFAFYSDLPTGDKVWYYGMQRYCKAGTQTLSGQVHELARMLNISFNFTPELEKEIKLSLCRTAFNKFKNNGSVSTWANDSELGDPKFYEQELKPLIEELNEAGKLLDDPKADVDKLFKEYAPRWAEFNYTIDAKRKDYLKKQFFLNK